MSNTNNFFIRNRNEKQGKLYFKTWLPQAYFPTVELLRKSVLETAVKKYNDELDVAITMCKLQEWNSAVKKLEHISKQFSAYVGALNPDEQRQRAFSEAYKEEKRQREEYEKQQNQGIIRKNIAEIVDNCVEVEEVLNEVRECLEQLDLSSINPDDPIASGILDVAEGVDGVADELSIETKEVLNEAGLTEPEFSKTMDAMLDEFINGYSLFGSDFDPALANPITFPRDESNLNA
ncbi:19853_t:CDS:2, partial [Racocetra fulgida]